MDHQTKSPISRPPTKLEIGIDRLFRGLCFSFAWLTIAVMAYIVIEISWKAKPAVLEYGPGFLSGKEWDPNTGEFGILPEIWGTLYSSLLALLIGSVFGIAVAVFLSEGYLGNFVFRVLKLFGVQFHRFWGKMPSMAESALKNLVELLAAIPSVVYGLWGIFVVIPLMRSSCVWLHDNMGWFPLFGTRFQGPGMLPAAFVLAIMILPTISAISRDALVAVPPKLREASYGLGATRWETILSVILPTASGGIFGGIVLAFGRALGETMALAMLVGNMNTISVSLFSPANTLAALLANNFQEAGSDEMKVGVLMYAGMVLMAITLVVNIIGALILQRATAGLKGMR
ncbi:phosphate ABC transporter permease subunit PstC [Bremerella sp. JC817]|uniref:phosphate ABC transporter permease subunit PstC n=1 Tax=Bremerella sp. JC817 TaxID=3231756 RepID=UPI0034580B55